MADTTVCFAFLEARNHCVAGYRSLWCGTICVNFNQTALRAKNFTSMHCTPSFSPWVPKDPLIGSFLGSCEDAVRETRAGLRRWGMLSASLHSAASTKYRSGKRADCCCCCCIQKLQVAFTELTATLLCRMRCSSSETFSLKLLEKLPRIQKVRDQSSVSQCMPRKSNFHAFANPLST